MKNNRKRILLISGFIIILCIAGYFVGTYINSRANNRISLSSSQGFNKDNQISQEDLQMLETQAIEIQKEAEITLVTQVLEDQTLERQASETKEVSKEATNVIQTKPETGNVVDTIVPISIRKISSEVIPYDGLMRSITCWGDSLTEGTGSGPNYPILTNIKINGVSTNVNGKTMPSTLGELTNLTVYNMGVYGEDSRTIACRQGGLKMYVNNITIPAIGTVRISHIICEDGKQVDPNLNGSYGAKACFDECSIGGINGSLSYDWDTDSFMFTRVQSGAELVISIDTQIITSPSIDRIGDILILQMGNNGGYDDNYDVLIAQYDAMIEYNQCKYYIIVGDTDYTAEYRADWENALKRAYGDHFINMRQYIVDFVNAGELNDMEIPVNPDDFKQLENGEVPYSLKVWDESHMNSYGYWIEGNAIYKKGCELGYWGY